MRGLVPFYFLLFTFYLLPFTFYPYSTMLQSESRQKDKKTKRQKEKKRKREKEVKLEDVEKCGDGITCRAVIFKPWACVRLYALCNAMQCNATNMRLQL